MVKSRKSAYDLVKIESGSNKQSPKNQNISISSDSGCNSVACDPVETGLSELETEAEEPTNHKAQNQGF